MGRTVTSTWTALTLACVLCGCGGPIVSIEHVLPADLPVPGGAERVEVGNFRPGPGTAESLAAMMAPLMQEALRKRGQEPFPQAATPPSPTEMRVRKSEKAPDPFSAGPLVRLTGQVDVEHADVRGERAIRRMSGGSGEPEVVQVPSLVRTVKVRVDFVLTRIADGSQVAAAESRRSYTSLADPRVRGELGLALADDPAAVPSVETVVGELLDQCAVELRGMIDPPTVAAEMPLRGTWDAEGGKALAAARKGDYAAALAHARTAAAARPDDANLAYNQAVLLEKAGKLDAALAAYLKARAVPAGQKDEQLQQAIQRVGRIQARLAGNEP